MRKPHRLNEAGQSPKLDIRLEVTLLTQVEKAARERNISKGAIIREAIRIGLERLKNEQISQRV